MLESASVLGPWSNFYAMIGSAAAALTGLMFVVITLVTGAGQERLRRAPDGISTFSTPTVMHFATALLISGILLAPWHWLRYPAIVLGIIGLCGIVYVLRVMRRAMRLSTYDPDAEDWTWYSILPLLAYVAILAGAILLFALPAKGLFAVAGAVMLLIFIGIRNAWDVVTFLAINGPPQPPGAD
jgi:hypothetical protein